MCIYLPIILILLISRSVMDEAYIRVVDKGIHPLVKKSVALRFFIDVLNEDHQNLCEVHSKVKKCCLTDTQKEDCGAIFVHSSNVIFLAPKERKQLVSVYPSMYPHDQVGFCDFYLHHKCNNKIGINHIVKVPFDTRLYKVRKNSPNLFSDYLEYQKPTRCTTLDQNSLEGCSPISCELKYNTRRLFYDTNSSKCIAVPECEGDIDKELPNKVYDFRDNKCRNYDGFLSFPDVYAISTGLGTVTDWPKQPTLGPDEVVLTNCSTISQNLNFLKDMIYKKLYSAPAIPGRNYGKYCKAAFTSILFCILTICASLLAFVFCINIAVVIYKKWRSGSLKATFENFKDKFKTTQTPTAARGRNSDIENVRNTLLREVIIKNIPLELRDSGVDICARIEEEIKSKKRYRYADLGSKNCFEGGNDVFDVTSVSSSMTVSDDSE